MLIIERMPLRALYAGKIQTQRVSVLDQAAKLASLCAGVDRPLLTIERRTSSPRPRTDSRNMLSVRGHCSDSWAFSDPTQTSFRAGVVSTCSPSTIQLFTRNTWAAWANSRFNAYRHSDSTTTTHQALLAACETAAEDDRATRFVPITGPESLK